eukprot:7835486-Prorocentrum_lima.AAC.1
MPADRRAPMLFMARWLRQGCAPSSLSRTRLAAWAGRSPCWWCPLGQSRCSSVLPGSHNPISR